MEAEANEGDVASAINDENEATQDQDRSATEYNHQAQRQCNGLCIHTARASGLRGGGGGGGGGQDHSRESSELYVIIHHSSFICKLNH